jgi:hypothetical protein
VRFVEPVHGAADACVSGPVEEEEEEELRGEGVRWDVGGGRG